MNLSAISVITQHARQIIGGSYKHVDRIFQLADKRNSPPEIAELAEVFGMMSVKVEAREFALDQTIDELREKKNALDQAIKTREEFSLIFCVITLCIGLYSFIVAILSGPRFRIVFGDTLDSFFTLFFCVGMTLVSAILVRWSGMPLSKFGVVRQNALQSVKESLSITAAMILAVVLFKWLARDWAPFRGKPFLNLDVFDGLFFIYFITAPLQEFIARGVFQSSIQRILCGRFRNLWAIVTTSLLFGAFHTFYSVPLAATTVLSSLVWGWLYSRHGTILGVSLSHMLIGNALVILDIWPFLAS